jgi:hypothetical protein
MMAKIEGYVKEQWRYLFVPRLEQLLNCRFRQISWVPSGQTGLQLIYDPARGYSVVSLLGLPDEHPLRTKEADSIYCSIQLPDPEMARRMSAVDLERVLAVELMATYEDLVRYLNAVAEATAEGDLPGDQAPEG